MWSFRLFGRGKKPIETVASEDERLLSKLISDMNKIAQDSTEILVGLQQREATIKVIYPEKDQQKKIQRLKDILSEIHEKAEEAKKKLSSSEFALLPEIPSRLKKLILNHHDMESFETSVLHVQGLEHTLEEMLRSLVAMQRELDMPKVISKTNLPQKTLDNIRYLDHRIDNIRRLLIGEKTDWYAFAEKTRELYEATISYKPRKNVA